MKKVIAVCKNTGERLALENSYSERASEYVRKMESGLVYTNEKLADASTELLTLLADILDNENISESRRFEMKKLIDDILGR